MSLKSVLVLAVSLISLAHFSPVLADNLDNSNPQSLGSTDQPESANANDDIYGNPPKNSANSADKGVIPDSADKGVIQDTPSGEEDY